MQQAANPEFRSGLDPYYNRGYSQTLWFPLKKAAKF